MAKIDLSLEDQKIYDTITKNIDDFYKFEGFKIVELLGIEDQLLDFDKNLTPLSEKFFNEFLDEEKDFFESEDFKNCDVKVNENVGDYPYTLAIAYYDNILVKRNTKKFIEYLQIASDLNFINAKLLLAILYDFGYLVEKDKIKSKEYITSIINNNNSIYINDFKEGLNVLKTIIKKGEFAAKKKLVTYINKIIKGKIKLGREANYNPELWRLGYSDVYFYTAFNWLHVCINLGDKTSNFKIYTLITEDLDCRLKYEDYLYDAVLVDKDPKAIQEYKKQLIEDYCFEIKDVENPNSFSERLIFSYLEIDSQHIDRKFTSPLNLYVETLKEDNIIKTLKEWTKVNDFRLIEIDKNILNNYFDKKESLEKTAKNILDFILNEYDENYINIILFNNMLNIDQDDDFYEILNLMDDIILSDDFGIEFNHIALIISTYVPYKKGKTEIEHLDLGLPTTKLYSDNNVFIDDSVKELEK